jgi:hypothetical protein
MAGLGATRMYKPEWRLATINRELDAGRPVVIGVDYKESSAVDHWITLTRRGLENGKLVYHANDPAGGLQIKLYLNGDQLSGGSKNYRSTGDLVVFTQR